MDLKLILKFLINSYKIIFYKASKNLEKNQIYSRWKEFINFKITKNNKLSIKQTVFLIFL